MDLFTKRGKDLFEAVPEDVVVDILCRILGLSDSPVPCWVQVLIRRMSADIVCLKFDSIDGHWTKGESLLWRRKFRCIFCQTIKSIGYLSRLSRFLQWLPGLGILMHSLETDSSSCSKIFIALLIRKVNNSLPLNWLMMAYPVLPQLPLIHPQIICHNGRGMK
ncbi:hypothetical protein CRG98_006672 [Punica granatum]|uniref:Uncharacterized protein n=1 Tax=Punica granatum TaxID=22663 RepID=A0A2I0KWX7_PUNGR|nr:hypothetical protein CRG98_006672 [Punica granatum]